MFFIMVLTLQVKKIIYFQIEGMLKKEARSIWDLVPGIYILILAQINSYNDFF